MINRQDRCPGSHEEVAEESPSRFFRRVIGGRWRARRKREPNIRASRLAEKSMTKIKTASRNDLNYDSDDG
jgi:hypothetical protein